MDKFFSDLLSKELVRNEKTLLYELKETSLNPQNGTEGLEAERNLNNLMNFFNLKVPTLAVYTPNEADVLALSNLTFLLGSLGFNTSNFTTNPAGYLLSAKNEEGKVCTIWANKTNEEFYREFLSELAKTQMQNDTSGAYSYLFELLNRKESNSKKSLPFSAVCAEFGKYLNDNSEKCKHVIGLINKALAEFHTINNENCKNNHFIMDRILLHENNISPENATPEELKEVEKARDEILQNYILPGYLTYRGKDRQNKDIPQNSQILNDRAFEILEKFKSKYDAITILNICSTDYSADIVEAIMQIYLNCKNPAEAEKEIQKINPKTPHNNEIKESIRKKLDEIWMYRVHDNHLEDDYNNQPH